MKKCQHHDLVGVSLAYWRLNFCAILASINFHEFTGQSVEQILRAYTRAGARAILASIDKRRFENRSEGQRLGKMLRFESSL